MFTMNLKVDITKSSVGLDVNISQENVFAKVKVGNK